jgi:hypothetical protein
VRMGTAPSTEQSGQAVEETAESAYQRKATAAYCKFGARDERRQPTLSTCLAARTHLYAAGVDWSETAARRPCRAVHPPQYSDALGTLSQSSNALRVSALP